MGINVRNNYDKNKVTQYTTTLELNLLTSDSSNELLVRVAC